MSNSNEIRKIGRISNLFNLLFNLLYNQLAWAYDLIAWIVSAGLWKSWVYSVLPYLHGERILEFGFGPGHLQQSASKFGVNIFGIDISWSMAKICKKLLTSANSKSKISLANAQDIPFPSAIFNQIVATFPAPYIFEDRTLDEINRLLLPGGELIIIPTAFTTSKFPIQRFFSWLFNLSTKPESKDAFFKKHFLEPLTQEGFQVTYKELIIKKSKVIIIFAKKLL
jgi:ubiquinone/menaquinone biosynthesis C-methylase UbiE